MGFEPLYEQLWNVSYDFLQKHCSIANTLTTIMKKRAAFLRSELLSTGNSKKKTFANDFRKAHDELQSMGKSVQTFVNDWQMLLIEQNTSLCTEEIVSAGSLVFDYIKAPLDYEKNQEVLLLVTDVPKTTQDVFCAIDQVRAIDLNRCVNPLQNAPKSNLAELPPPGTVFGVMLEGCWFRAVRNTPVCADGKETIALCLLESGEVLRYQDSFRIAELPGEFQAISSFFIKCRIVPDTTPHKFARLDKISCKVIDVENGNVLYVERLPESRLKDKQAAESQLKKEQPDGSQYAISRDTLSKEELKQWDELPESTTNAMKAVQGYVPKDDVLICKFYNPKTKGCFKGGNCRLRHVEKDPNGWTLDRDTVSVSVPAKMEIPLPNTIVKLHPTFVIDLEMFYSQLVQDERCLMAFTQLLSDMNNPKEVTQYKKLKLLPSIGELVLAQYESVWYRATVCDLFDNDVGVFYVDYGNAATLGMDEIRKCDDRFKYLPYQAVCCRIANARRVKPYHVEAIEQLTNAILDKQLDALIIDNKHPWEVQLFDQEGFDIGQGMIIANLALPRQPLKFDDVSRVPG